MLTYRAFYLQHCFQRLVCTTKLSIANTNLKWLLTIAWILFLVFHGIHNPNDFTVYNLIRTHSINVYQFMKNPFTYFDSVFRHHKHEIWHSDIAQHNIVSKQKENTVAHWEIEWIFLLKIYTLVHIHHSQQCTGNVNQPALCTTIEASIAKVSLVISIFLCFFNKMILKSMKGSS